MRNFLLVLSISVGLFVTGAVRAAQKPTQTSKPAASSNAVRAPQTTPAIRPIATVKELMNGIMDPASDAIFDAVGSTETISGIEEKAPKTDEEWNALRNSALAMMETANLVMMPNRQIGDPEIEARVVKDRANFVKAAQNLIAVGRTVLKAIDAKDRDAVFEAGDAIDTACENCHARYWYPDQPQPIGVTLNDPNSPTRPVPPPGARPAPGPPTP